MLMLRTEAWQEFSAKTLQQKYVIVIKIKTSEQECVSWEKRDTMLGSFKPSLAGPNTSAWAKFR